MKGARKTKVKESGGGSGPSSKRRKGPHGTVLYKGEEDPLAHSDEDESHKQISYRKIEDEVPQGRIKKPQRHLHSKSRPKPESEPLEEVEEDPNAKYNTLLSSLRWSASNLQLLQGKQREELGEDDEASDHSSAEETIELDRKENHVDQDEDDDNDVGDDDEGDNEGDEDNEEEELQSEEEKQEDVQETKEEEEALVSEGEEEETLITEMNHYEEQKADDPFAVHFEATSLDEGHLASLSQPRRYSRVTPDTPLFQTFRSQPLSLPLPNQHSRTFQDFHVRITIILFE